MSDLIFRVQSGYGLITLNRPKALNALTLNMVRELTQALLEWQASDQVRAVVIRGSNKEGPFGAFCAGGDIRFFHQAALAGDPALEDFFTEEYRLNHLIHNYPKPYVALMDGIVMGGGMGISQGASLRIVTERTRMAMPETGIGLFPDVGGGYFLSRCPGHAGEYLALTGQVIHGADAVWAGLADRLVASEHLSEAWAQIEQGLTPPEAVGELLAATSRVEDSMLARQIDKIDHCFAGTDVQDIVSRLSHDASDWAQQTLALLRKRSPLMLHVVLEQIRRARSMPLADDLRMERDLVRHCFHPQHLLRSPAQSETVEGIRALAVDKDHAPQWMHPAPDAVTPAQVQPFFNSPWPAHAHPLRDLS